MDKKRIIEVLLKTVLYLVGVSLLIGGYYFNENYKRQNDIQATTGATKISGD